MFKLISFFFMMILAPVLLPFWILWVILSWLEKGRKNRREREIERGVNRALEKMGR